MRAMRVLGIDPGSETTGWGVIEGDGPRYKILEYGAIRLAAGQKFSASASQSVQGHRGSDCPLQP